MLSNHTLISAAIFQQFANASPRPVVQQGLLPVEELDCPGRGWYDVGELTGESVALEQAELEDSSFVTTLLARGMTDVQFA